MNFTTIFIKRPVATMLLTLAICLAGSVAYTLLPVSPLPQVDFPVIFVSARMPGASPKTMAASVATPLERSLGTIAGISEMTSISSQGFTRVVVVFDLNRDIDGAARDVQAAINNALSDLPAGMPNNPTYRKVNPSDAPIMMVALTSESLPTSELYDISSTILAQKISQVDGIGQVDVGGGSLPAVRIELNIDMLNQYGISLEQVRTAIQNFNTNLPKGAVEAGDKYWQIAVNDQAHKAAEYDPLIVTWRDNAPVRLKDVATITDSVQDIRNSGLANGKPAVILVIYRKPGANIIAAVDAVKATLPQLKASIPDAVDMRQLYDSTTTIRSSLREVTFTLYISIVLVILVVFLFLRTLRATFIPSIAIISSLIGTFAGMYLCGYSIDNLSLMALAVATGFVVDDAIVVLENISRHKEGGLSPMQAAITGAKEVSFTVISISVSLVAVFIPILFMGGIVGRLFREFAVTLSLAIGVSLLLSLSLTPMLCAYLLKNGTSGHTHMAGGHTHTSGWKGVVSQLGSLNNLLQKGYMRSLRWVLDHKFIILCLWFATVALNIHLYIIAPKGFFPQQDTGRIMGSLRADQSISFQALRVKLEKLMETARTDPAVDTVAGFTGSNSSTAFISISLKPRRERDTDAQGVIARLRAKVNREPGAELFMQAAQDIRAGGRSSRASYQYTLQADDLDTLRHWTAQLQLVMLADPMFKDINSDQEDAGLQSTIEVDRDSAGRLGITMRQMDAALNNAFGQRQVSTMYRDRNQYRVVMIGEKRHWSGPEGLQRVYVPGRNGTLVPLGAFSSNEPSKAPVRVNHQGQMAATTISFNLAPGISLSEATQRILDLQADIQMPQAIRASFQGTARVFKDSMSSQPWLILAALVTLYIVLGVLYESFIHPITILSTLPSAGIGALLALRMFGMEFSIIALIGVLLLAGIVKKNAILLIDFAIAAERNDKLGPVDSIITACRLRFRPIMMTTMAALLGAVPLAIGFGDGSELRRPLGVSIIGGLVMSQVLTLYTTPVLYLYLGRVSHWWHSRALARAAARNTAHSIEETV